jgi:ribonuclease-3
VNLDAIRAAVRAEHRGLVEEALTHPSYTNEHPGTRSQARLEFLGDAVLKLALAQILFERFPDQAEDQLTIHRIALENGAALADVGRRIGIADALRLGRGEHKSGDDESRLADTVEALLAALYLGAGYRKARQCVEEWFADALDAPPARLDGDAYPLVRQRAEARGLALVEEFAEDSGWVATLRMGDQAASGRGASKKKARAAAARQILDALDLSS